jgi:hypothetical protein
MLRDCLTRLPGIGTWPCDEINPIWRHGNKEHPTDEFSRSFATPRVKSFIRNQFEKLRLKRELTHVVEKTCANSLRVEFIDEIFPEAQFVFLVRDGRDVVASAMKRWVAPLDILYIMRKARFVPLADVPHYASRYFINRILQFYSKERKLSFWGPRFEGMKEAVRTKSLLEVCAEQWARCVQKSIEQMRDIESSRIYSLKYEDFVRSPASETEALAGFLGVKVVPGGTRRLVSDVSPKSIGKWRTEFSKNDLRLVEPLIEAAMRKFGYF